MNKLLTILLKLQKHVESSVKQGKLSNKTGIIVLLLVGSVIGYFGWFKPELAITKTVLENVDTITSVAILVVTALVTLIKK
jgi:hypothetical protein